MTKPTSKGKITLKRAAKSSSAKAADVPVSKPQKSAPKKADPEVSETEIPEAEDLSDDTDSGLDDDDEMDLQDLGSSDDESEDENDPEKDDSGSENGESDSDEESDEFPMRKKKKTADDGRQTFASAFNAIMGSKLKAYDRKDPILARNKAVSKQLESSKLESRAKRALHVEKAELLDMCHVRQLLPSADEPEKARKYLEKEKALKKTAQRGVVKLFNAVMSSQALAADEVDHSMAGPSRKNELMTEMTKSSFLDMVKAAGEE